MNHFSCTDIIDIKSHEISDDAHLRFYVATGNTQCGTIDFISENINFYISCKRNVFKGMVSIKNIRVEYKPGRLVFILNDKTNLTFNCSMQLFEVMDAHIQRYKNSDHNRNIRDAFYND